MRRIPTEDKNAILPIDAAIQSNLRADQGQQGRYGAGLEPA
jgi:hypothetical protein